MESAAGTGCELTAADCLEEQIFIKKGFFDAQRSLFWSWNQQNDVLNDSTCFWVIRCQQLCLRIYISPDDTSEVEQRLH